MGARAWLRRRQAPHWLQSFFLPLFMFPFLRDCRQGDDHGWERGRRLSEQHGTGAMASLDALPAAFAAYVQARRGTLEGAGTKRQGWAVLWFLFKHNRRDSLWLAVNLTAYVCLRVFYLIMYDQYMAAANQQYQFLLVGWGARALRWVTLGFCLATLALNLAMYFMERAYWRYGFKLRQQVVWVVNQQVLAASQHDLNSHSSAGQVVTLMADARQYEYMSFVWRLLSVPFDVVTTVLLMWRLLSKSWWILVVTLLPAIVLLVVQPWLNGIFARGLERAAELREERINASRDGLVNFLPTKLFGAQGVLLQRAHAAREREAGALMAGFHSYAFLCACQIWMPVFITALAAGISFQEYLALSTMEVFSVLGYAKLLCCDCLYSLNFSLATCQGVLLSSSRLCQLMLGTLPAAPGGKAAPAAPAAAAAAAGAEEQGKGACSEGSEALAVDGKGEELAGSTQPSPAAPAAFELRDFEVWWPKAEAPAVRVPSLDVRPGQLVAVYGGVGCGKSSLMLGLLGELGRGEGAAPGPAPLAGTTVAYAPQTPLIIQDTIKANILFGLGEDGERLAAAVHAAGFSEDVARFEQGLETPVAEKGTSLSGGQRIRLALARCAYAALSGRVGAVLLDDPLAGVDPEKAELIFQRLIARGGALEGLTRLVAVSDHALLPRFDIVLDLGVGAAVKSFRAVHDAPASEAQPQPGNQNGSADGKPPDAGASSKAASAAADNMPALCWRRAAFAGDDALDAPPLKLPRVLGVRRSKKGTAEHQAARWKDDGAGGAGEAPAPIDGDEVDRSSGFGQWKALIRSMGFRSSLVIGAGLTVCTFCLLFWQLVTQSWLDRWAAGDPYGVYRLLSLVFGFGTALFSTAAVIGQTRALIAGATRSLSAALAGVYGAPYAFFQANPSSRILSRLSDDQRRIDEHLNNAFLGCATLLCMAVVSLVMVIISLPWMVAIIVPALVLLQFLRTRYVGANKALRHEESASSSRVTAASAETLEGAAVARAFGQQGLLLERLRAQMATHVVWNDGIVQIEGWLIYACNVLVYCPIAVGAIILSSFLIAGDPTSDTAATLISNIFIIASLVYALAACLSEVESQLIAMVRVRELAQLEPERAAVRRLDDGDGKAAGGVGAAPWPSEGRICFEETTAAYHWGADPAVSRVCLDIPPGTSCVLMGHSGSGKSTLVLALTGLIPVLSGDIDVDGRSTLALPLEDLRSGLACVPQEPALFKGTVRFNLDLLGTHPDAQLWEVLAMVSPALADAIRALGGLDAELDPQKPVISRGQMQLLCLARAILRDAPILVLDEANASVDAETDALMEEFVSRFTAGQEGLTRRRRTLVQVSHKATGLRRRDRVVVLEAGRVVEQGPPAELLERPDGRFAAMLHTLEGSGGGGAAERGG